MTRQEAIEEGGFVWFRCSGCDRMFWSDNWALCELCRAGRIEDDERRHDAEVEVLDWESLLRRMEETCRTITQTN